LFSSLLFFPDTATTEIYTLSLHDALPILGTYHACRRVARTIFLATAPTMGVANQGLEDIRVKLGAVMPGEPPAQFADGLRRLGRSEDHTSELQSRENLVCRLLLEKKKKNT